MFDPANPLSLPADHPLLSPSLSLDKLRQNPGLVKESLDLLGGLSGLGLINPVGGDGGLWQTVAGPLGAGGSSLGLYFLINSAALGRLIRYTARYLFETCGLCQAAVEWQEVLSLAEGFSYTGKTAAGDKRLQAWLRKSNSSSAPANTSGRKSSTGSRSCGTTAIPPTSKSAGSTPTSCTRSATVPTA